LGCAQAAEVATRTKAPAAIQLASAARRVRRPSTDVLDRFSAILSW
jgi:hypothetical protein